MADSKHLDEYIKSDDALFHYTRTSIALEKILYDNRIKLSLLQDTSDPCEYKFKFFGMQGRSLPPKAEKIYHEAHPVFDRIFRTESRVMCFCSNALPTIICDDGNSFEDTIASKVGWSKSRMWSQYGENHYGICLVFSRSAIEAELNDKKDRHNGFVAENVKYTTVERPPLILNGNKLMEEKIDQYCMNYIKTNASELFFTKHIDYRDESEYRVVVFDPKHKMEFIDISKSIRGIIAGDRTPKIYFTLIRELSDRYGVECRRAYWDSGQWHLLLVKEENRLKA